MSVPRNDVDEADRLDRPAPGAPGPVPAAAAAPRVRHPADSPEQLLWITRFRSVPPPTLLTVPRSARAKSRRDRTREEDTS